jgi:NitT/TauT family transport system substrate-binding protein
MNVKLRQMVAILLIGIGLLTACIAPPVAAPPSADQAAVDAPADLIPLKVGTLPFLSNAILQIAQEKGYFAEQGLAVEFVVQQSSNEFIPLLLQGELDVATPALTAGFFNAVASGGNLRLVLPLTTFTTQSCSAIGIVARRSDVDAGAYATPAQWQGAKVTLPPAGAQALPGYVIDTILQQGKLTLQDVQLTAVELPAQAEALATGQTDLIYAVEPWITRMTNNLALALLQPAEPVVPDLTASMIVFGAKPLADPAIGTRFAIAYLQAVRQYNAGKTADNVTTITAYTKLEPALVEKLCWTASPPDGAINVDSIMAYQSWLQTQGVLDRILKPEEFLDQQFVDAANQQVREVAR